MARIPGADEVQEFCAAGEASVPAREDLEAAAHLGIAQRAHLQAVGLDQRCGVGNAQSHPSPALTIDSAVAM